MLKEKMKLNFTWKIWLLISLLLLSLLSVFGLPPTFLQKGVLITSVEINSTTFNQGLREGQIITAIDGKKIESLEDFSNSLQGKFIPNETVKTVLIVENSEIILFSDQAPEITVSDIPNSNIKLGLDLIGGSRALIQAEDRELSLSEVGDLVEITENRLNEFGLTDLNVRQVSDLAGNNFMLVEIAGATPKDLRDLISQQGKFEAKIGNDTVFVGGKDKDIASVCRGDPTCALVEQCGQLADGYHCNFRFTVYLSEDAAKRHADLTRDLAINATPQGNYLSQNLDLYLDDKLVDTLRIGESLKGVVTTQVSVSGSGVGETQNVAFESAEEEMRKLQTILITGSLPYKLKIVKLDTISPVLGSEFIRSILIAGVAALLAVSLFIFIRYKKIKSSLALLITSVSEIILILGIAALIEWNLDLPSIAGILVVVGTGIDQQIIILDEARQGTFLNIRQRMKRAFAIILGAYFTAVVAMLPLLWAGAGLLKGFAFTTIIGITAGVLITRPAFTDMVRKIEE
jgi:preprotein translocase subunit SecD